MEKKAISKMSSRTLLATITLLLLFLLIWQIRWVFIVFFGAIVIAVTLDILIKKLQSYIKISRSLALLLVLLALVISGIFVFNLLVPELITQVKELGNLFPTLLEKDKFNTIQTRAFEWFTAS
jgi:predicted PurR-regulated permease PerM